MGPCRHGFNLLQASFRTGTSHKTEQEIKGSMRFFGIIKFDVNL